MKKCFLLLFFCISGFSDPSSFCEKPISPTPSCEPSPPSCESPPSPSCTKNPSSHHNDLFRKQEESLVLDLEFLYTTIVEGSLDYALKMRRPSGFSLNYAQGDFQRGNYGWDPGFRIEIGYFRALKYWEVLAGYTWMKITGSDSVKRPDNNRFITGTFPQIFTDPMEEARSHLHFQYNVVDLMAARVFCPNPHLRVRSYFGLSGAFFKQTWKVGYFNASNQNTMILNNWHYRSGGLMSKFVFDWFWTEDLYIVGKTHFALYLGRYKNLAHQTTNVNRSGNDNINEPIRDAIMKDLRFAYNFFISLGPSWQKSFSTSRIEIFAGWEFIVWWNVQEIYRSNEGTPFAAKETWLNQGMLGLHGLKTRLTFNF